jgi:hypothetical protein
MNARPQVAAWFCEVRPAVSGSSFLFEGKQRVLGWTADGLPRTTYGTVNRRSFDPDPRDPTAGMAFVEHRAPDGSRRWWNPNFDDALTDANLKAVMRGLLAENRAVVARR